MDDLDIILMFVVGMGCLALGLFIGVSIGNPNELENGCVIHSNNIYCEVNNE